MDGNIYASVPHAETQRTLAGGAIHLAALGREYGKKDDKKAPEVVNWTFSNLQKPEDAKKESPLTKYLPTIAKNLGVGEILVPSPVKFSGQFCGYEELNVPIELEGGLIVRRGAFADGCMLGLRQSFMISGAGCAVIVAWRYGVPNYGPLKCVAVAHCGLMSALNGVMQNLVCAMQQEGENMEDAAKEAHVSIEFPISSDLLTYPWDDPELGALQQALCEYIFHEWGAECVPGYLDPARQRQGAIELAAIGIQRLLDTGVPRSQITFNNMISRWNQDALYHTRDGLNGRNLFMVTRYR